MNDEEKEQLVYQIFFPNLFNKRQKILDSGMNFVHYTSAEAVFQIIENEKFWMRKSGFMNDFSEGVYGHDCLLQAWGPKDQDKSGIKAILNTYHENISDEIAAQFRKDRFNLENETFLASFSEHDHEAEDEFGRLSMWRAYGGNIPVALVLNSSSFFNESDLFDGVYAFPVIYGDPDFLTDHYRSIAGLILKNEDFIKSMPKNVLTELVVNMLRITMLTTKHKGFEEEKEWRVIFSPKIVNNEYVEKRIVVCGGAPQEVYEIPLENKPEEGIETLAIKDFFKKIIIGPCENPFEVYRAFCVQLEKKGISNPGEIFSISNIPLRTH